MLGEFSGIFSDVPEHTPVVKCHLRLSYDVFTQVWQFLLHFTLQNPIEEKVGDMRSEGIVARSKSAYNLPGVVTEP